jgi:YegS/Rv2252/BmrU family lipid kinase
MGSRFSGAAKKGRTNMATPTATPPENTTIIEGPARPDWTEDDRKCVTVIFNPVSGQGDPEERKRVIEEALAEHGYRAQHLVTTPEQGARYFAEQALKDGVDLLAVSGGDGTAVEAMSALVGTSVPIAVFPAGTGNLLSVNLALPKEVPQGVHAALFGTKRSLDLARISTDGGDSKYFAIIAGAGYDAKVIQDADRETKNKLGLFAYFWSAIRNLRKKSVIARIRLDDKRPFRRRVKSVMVANMGRIQGGVDMVPDAWPDDGLLDVTILKVDGLGDWVRLAWSALRRKLREDRAIEYHAAKKVHVEFSFPQPVQFDGEDAGRVRAFTAEVVPNAVQVMVPKEAPV